MVSQFRGVLVPLRFGGRTYRLTCGRPGVTALRGFGDHIGADAAGANLHASHSARGLQDSHFLKVGIGDLAGPVVRVTHIATLQRFLATYFTDS